jgi:hypothetical protein
MTKKTWAIFGNPQNLWPGSWDLNNPIEKKINKYEAKFSINLVLKDEIEKKNLLKIIKINLS